MIKFILSYKCMMCACHLRSISSINLFSVNVIYALWCACL